MFGTCNQAGLDLNFPTNVRRFGKSLRQEGSIYGGELESIVPESGPAVDVIRQKEFS